MSFAFSSKAKIVEPDEEGKVLALKAKALPPAHPAEADTFARHQGIPGHRQQALSSATIALVGAGGLNSIAALALARAGAGRIVVIDPDRVDRTNLTRQLYCADDLGQPKALCLARNLLCHMTFQGQIQGVWSYFEDAGEHLVKVDLLIVGVDNNACRLAACRFARAQRVPAVFTMLSRDGMRLHCFFQGPEASGPCLWCALPDLDPEAAAPCASAIITSCLLAGAFATFFAHRALMGWPAGVEPFNWRQADLLAISPEVAGRIEKNPHCSVCGQQEAAGLGLEAAR